jgi:hypothetical protein
VLHAWRHEPVADFPVIARQSSQTRLHRQWAGQEYAAIARRQRHGSNTLFSVADCALVVLVAVGATVPLPFCAICGCPFVCRIFEDAPDRGAIPHGFPGPGLLLGCIQAALDLSNGTAVSSYPFKDLTDHTRFLQHDLETSLSSAFPFADIAVSIGSAGEDAHVAHLSGMSFASPTPFQDFRPFVLGNHPLDAAQRS